MTEKAGRMSRPTIAAVQFMPDGSVALDYLIPQRDAKAGGVIMSHNLFVPGDADYQDEIDAVRDAAIHLLRDVLDDFPRLTPAGATLPTYELPEDEDT